MQEINLILSENKDFKFVGVKFDENAHKVYYYKTLLDFEVGDKAIVDSPYEGLVIVDVVEVKSALQVDGNFRYKWIVNKVDLTEYQRLNEQEEKILETLAEYRGSILKKEMYESLKEELGTTKVNQLKKLSRL